MRRRKLWILLAVLVVAAAIASVVYLRKRGAPEPVRLLPESDAVLYINFKLMRVAHVFAEATPVSYDPEYEQFVKETGFQFERDLDQAAFALHAGAVPAAGHEDFFDRARFSEIFIGRFDVDRATAYFRKLATATEQYRDATIYSVPHEGRTVRVTFLGLDTVAASNTLDSGPIHQMIDKYRAAAWPASSPTLVRENYRHVPLASVVWALARIPAKGPQTAALDVPGGMVLPLQWLAGSTLVASARYVGSIHLRVDALTQNENDARQLTDTLKTFLAMFQSVDVSTQHGGADPDVKALFESLKVEEHGTRVAVTAILPQGFIRKALSPPASPPVQPRTPAPAKPSRKPKGK